MRLGQQPVELCIGARLGGHVAPAQGQLPGCAPRGVERRLPDQGEVFALLVGHLTRAGERGAHRARQLVFAVVRATGIEDAQLFGSPGDLGESALWITVACVAVPTFFYQNSGWVQFGYRFSLDYTPFLILLLAVGGRPLDRVARALIVVGVAVNLFGAWSFARRPEYYRTGGDAYGTVVAH